MHETAALRPGRKLSGVFAFRIAVSTILELSPHPIEQSVGTDHDHTTRTGLPEAQAEGLAEPKIKKPRWAKAQWGFCFSWHGCADRPK
jgi:hypothetical protein